MTVPMLLNIFVLFTSGVMAFCWVKTFLRFKRDAKTRQAADAAFVGYYDGLLHLNATRRRRAERIRTSKNVPRTHAQRTALANGFTLAQREWNAELERARASYAARRHDVKRSRRTDDCLI